MASVLSINSFLAVDALKMASAWVYVV